MDLLTAMTLEHAFADRADMPESLFQFREEQVVRIAEEADVNVFI